MKLLKEVLEGRYGQAFFTSDYVFDETVTVAPQKDSRGGHGRDNRKVTTGPAPESKTVERGR